MTKMPNSTDVLVGSKIRLRRKELRLSQEKLAHALGITFQQVQKYEKGTNRVGASRLQAIADVLSAPISYFFPEQGSPTHAEIDLLASPGALDLLRAYATLDAKVQKAITDVAIAAALDSPPRQKEPKSGAGLQSPS